MTEKKNDILNATVALQGKGNPAAKYKEGVVNLAKELAARKVVLNGTEGKEF